MSKDIVPLTIGLFSKKTGVSVRTLRYYDEIGLLTPHKDPKSGHRLYDYNEMMRLQHILCLKTLGYSLEHISELIRKPTFDSNWADTLQLQKNMLEQKQKEIELTLHTMDRILKLIASEQEVDRSALLSLIHGMQTEQEQKEWLYQQLDSSVIDSLFERTTESQTELDQQFIRLTQEVKKLAGCPVELPEVQELIRMQLQMNMDMLGNASLADYAPLAEMEDDSLEALTSLSPSPFTPEEEEWLHQVMTYYMEQHDFQLPGQQ
ncbi:MerR family transcriptional regulator [Paenibacillus sp. 11B]|uniref:MerR family transcriptional regulator n=1 Tax=unclassified Paenibacillus TaxID=185978 RepID=UPI00264F4CA9|nr:MerR family transcriptional regulator [Paenibacillus sp. 11B]MDN8588638.1 MerR family transcriptional regulator [Paenibacillus sp. 11B]